MDDSKKETGQSYGVQIPNTAFGIVGFHVWASSRQRQSSEAPLTGNAPMTVFWSVTRTRTQIDLLLLSHVLDVIARDRAQCQRLSSRKITYLLKCLYKDIRTNVWKYRLWEAEVVPPTEVSVEALQMVCFCFEVQLFFQRHPKLHPPKRRLNNGNIDQRP
jgi:hypothetical protein